MPGRSLASVYVTVRGETSELGRDIETGARRADTGKVGDHAGRQYGHAFAGGARRIIGGVGALVAAAGIGRIVRESVSGFKEHQQVVAQTNAVLRSTKGAANVSTGAVVALSDALERKTKVDGDVILSGSNMLATFTNIQNRVGKGNDIFNRATATVLDMSVALGQDTKNSAIQLGKALNDPVKGVTALQRVGVTFTKSQRDQIDAMVKAGNVAGAQKVILAELNKEFGGSAKAQGDALGAQGRLTVAWHQAQDTLGAALLPLVDRFEGALADRLPGAAEKAAAGIKLADVGVRAMIAAFRQGDVTSTGFIGKMQRAGIIARAASTEIQNAWYDVQEGFRVGAGTNPEDAMSRFGTAFQRVGIIANTVSGYLHRVDFRTVATDAGQAGRELRGINVQGLATQLRSVDTSHFADGLNLAGRALGFVADHADLVIKALPFLLAGYAAYKAAEAAANVAALAGIPIRAAQVVSNVILARSIKSLAAGNVENAVATSGQTAAQAVNVAVTNAATASTQRGTFATIASATAQKVVRGATLAWAGAQWLINAALTANPIGLVIVAVAALVAGIIFAYRHSETFRRVVNGAFHDVATAGQWMWDRVLRPVFRFIVGAWFTVAGAIVNGAARAFGWVPGLGPKLRAAAATFNRFRDQVNNALDGVKNKNVTVTARASVLMGQGLSRSDAISTSLHRAAGGPIRGPGTSTSDSIAAWLSDNEHVWSAREVAGAGGHDQVARLRKLAAAGRLPGFAAGGPVRFDIHARSAGLPRFRTDIAAVDRFATDLVTGAARRAAATAVPRFTGNASVAAVAAAVAATLGRPGEAAAWARRIMFESGGNWSAVNRWDSNWRAGHPSVGGAQVIAGTFAAYAGRYRNMGPFLYGVSIDPFANSYAGARYAVSRYGSIAAVDPLVRPRGYDKGGWLPPGLSVVANGTGRAERVRTGAQEDALLAALERIERAMSGSRIQNHWHVQGIAPFTARDSVEVWERYAIMHGL